MRMFNESLDNRRFFSSFLLINQIIVIRYFMVCLTFKFNIFKKLSPLLRVFLPNLKGMVISLQTFTLASCSLSHLIQNSFQTYREVAPNYLCELITNYHAVRALRSNNMMLLHEPKIKGKRMAQ